MAPKKNQHYVPKVHLREFTDSAADQLFVFDKKTGSSYPTNIRNIAAQNNFYTLEHQTDQFAIEDFYHNIETLVKPSFDFINKSKTIPSGDLLEHLILMMAAAFTRVPRTLNGIEDFHAAILKKQLWYAINDDNHFHQIADQTSRPTKEWESDQRLLKKLIDADQIEISINKDFKLSQAMPLFNPVFEALANRKWSLVERTSNASKFICSDCPLSVSWTNPTPGPYLPALGLKNTTVLFPASESFVLIGRFEDDQFPIKYDTENICIINTHTANAATRFIYSSTNDISLMLPNQSIGNWNDYKSAIIRD